MSYRLTEYEAEKIKKAFGAEYPDRLNAALEECESRCKLKITGCVDYFSVNCIFTCESERHGDAILKVFIKSPGDVFPEANLLWEYGGRGFVKCHWRGQFEWLPMLLEERVTPGDRLSDEPSLDRRLTVFTSLFRGLHIKPDATDGYREYGDWVKDAAAYMAEKRGVSPALTALADDADRALSVFSIIAESQPDGYLLHGDFHYDNILLDGGGRYKIIDPKGALGPVVFDLPRYILNEYCRIEDFPDAELSGTINYIIGCFERELDIPAELIKRSYYVEAVLASCWDVQDSGGYDRKTVTFARRLMDGIK